MAFLQYYVPTTTVALTAATAKTVLSIQAPANQVLKVLEQKISHDGATSTNAPDLTEFGRCTFGAAGTATIVTPSKKDPGRQETIQTTAYKNYSAEPTTITAIDPGNTPQYNGMYHYITPDSRTLVVVGGQGWVMRITSPNNVNACARIEAEE